ncbi:MAG: aldose epimerase family protein [Eubacteriales bacterium]|nr:aldose epimerase family protein [Eubacteriales bacterium]
MGVTVKDFGTLSTGENVQIYCLKNAAGAYAEVMNYGAILVNLCVKDKDGSLRDVVLGSEDVKYYEKNPCFFGATIGRSGNRIAGAKFTIAGKEYRLAENENDNNLHSGPDGFEKKLWNAKEVLQEENAVVFERISPDGENGFPGNMTVTVKYSFDEEQKLTIEYGACCDQDSIANFTNHSYFNLNGEGSGSILGQKLQILADCYTPVLDSHAIPTGEHAPVKGTPMDFTTYKTIGEDIEKDFEQLHFTGGFDHNYVTNDYVPGVVRVIANAYSDESGIAMEVTSDAPCVQLYAGNFIGEQAGKKGHTYHSREGFCLETQVEPNAINQANFHQPVLKAKETYSSVTAYRFFTK